MRPVPLKEIEAQLAETSAISNAYLNRKIKTFFARTIIGVLTLMLLWGYHPFVKWASLLIIPFAAFSLWKILSTRSRLNKQMKDIKQTINDIQGKDKI